MLRAGSSFRGSCDEEENKHTGERLGRSTQRSDSLETILSVSQKGVASASSARPRHERFK